MKGTEMGKIVMSGPQNVSLDGVVQDPDGEEGFTLGGWFLQFGINSMPKYVVSSTLEDPEWNNSTVLKGDVVTEVSKLKQRLDGEIVVPASYQLGRTLIEHDLVDELRLVVFPVVLGAGERLFGETSDKRPMRLLDARTIGEGLAYLTYGFVHEA
jgi:dihydrofolate reductase